MEVASVGGGSVWFEAAVQITRRCSASRRDIAAGTTKGEDLPLKNKIKTQSRPWISVTPKMRLNLE